VYTVAPYPDHAREFGRYASLIASRDSGAVVQITSDNSDNAILFMQGFGRSNSFMPSPGAPNGIADPYWQSGPFTTWTYIVP
jgi:hypothetical protein